MTKPTLVERWPDAALALGGACLAALGATILLGWRYGVPVAQAPIPGFGPVAANIAAAVLFQGLGWSAAAVGNNRLSVLCGVLVFGLGLGGSIGHLLRADFDVDPWLFGWFIADERAYVGRPPLNASILFALTGIGTIILGLFPGRRRGALLLWLAGALAAIVGIAAATRLAGLWVQESPEAAWRLGVAALVGTGPLVLAGALRAFLGRGVKRESARVREWNPRLVAIGVLVGNLGIWMALRAQQEVEVRRTVEAAAADVRSEVEARLDIRVQALAEMATREERGEAGPTEDWTATATAFVKHFPGVQTLMWLGPSLEVRRIAPLTENEDALGLSLRDEPFVAAAVARARDQRRPALSASEDIGNGLRAFFIAAPVLGGEEPRGYLVAVCLAQRMLGVMLRNVAAGHPLEVAEADGAPVYERDKEGALGRPGEASVEVLGGLWRVRAWRSAQPSAASPAALANFIFAAGFVLSLVLGGAVRLAQSARDRAREIVEANWALQSEIRERRRTEAALAARSEELERSNKELDDFAYIASHDLKEPLRGISHYAQFLMEDYGDKLDAEGKDRLVTLGRLTQRMEKLIDSLLEYSRAGRVHLAIAETDLNDVVHDVLESLNFSLKERGVEVRVPEPLPTVACDRVRTTEVFRNLVTNAMKYNDKPRKIIEIGVRPPSAEDAEGAAARGPVLYVRDNGIGIREKHLDKVFQMFRRLHGQDKYGGGTGVGLALVKKVLERQGGRIWVESVFGEGATFYFTVRGDADGGAEERDPAG